MFLLLLFEVYFFSRLKLRNYLVQSLIKDQYGNIDTRNINGFWLVNSSEKDESNLMIYDSCSSWNTAFRILTNPLGLQKIYEYEWKQQLWSTSFVTHLISPLLSGFEAEIYYQLVASGSVTGRCACHSGIKNGSVIKV